MDCEDDGMDVSEVPGQVYVPGRSRELAEDEELVMDTSAYRLYYQLQVEAPSLSFDILPDCMGDNREIELNGEATSAYIVAGTQAMTDKPNNLIVMKMSNLKPMKTKTTSIENDDEESSDSDSDEENLDGVPEVEAAKIEHNGTINRVRTEQCNGVYLAATWSEMKEINIWNLSRPLSAVNDSIVMSEYTRTRESPKPVFTFKGHKNEGYALAWCPCISGCLATGDCNGAIHIWQPREASWTVSEKPFNGHCESVEDIQWSPTEATVFISCSTDQSLRVWDTRNPSKNSAMITVPKAHESDVNVISWGKMQPASIISGGDDGMLKVWDLRMIHRLFKSSETTNVVPYTNSFNYHKKPITSVEWHPSEAGLFLATSEDDQTTMWDIGLEQDATETSQITPNGTDNQEICSQLPVQLLFIHTGQVEVKEAHWHPQVPGLVINTALDGLNIYRTICI